MVLPIRRIRMRQIDKEVRRAENPLAVGAENTQSQVIAQHLIAQAFPSPCGRPDRWRKIRSAPADAEYTEFSKGDLMPREMAIAVPKRNNNPAAPNATQRRQTPSINDPTQASVLATATSDLQSVSPRHRFCSSRQKLASCCLP